MTNVGYIIYSREQRALEKQKQLNIGEFELNVMYCYTRSVEQVNCQLFCHSKYVFSPSPSLPFVHII